MKVFFKIRTLAAGEKSRFPDAFTLIELLTVVCVVAVLAALLMPALKGMHNKGKQAACTSNMRQLAMGCILYAQDHDGAVPYTPEDSAWHRLIFEYLNINKVTSDWQKDYPRDRYYFCPSDKDPYTNSLFDYGVLSYGFNRDFRRSGQNYAVRLHSLPKAAVMIGESQNFTFNHSASQPVEYRHRKGANFAFTDGRVELHLPVDVTEDFLKVRE